MKYDGFMKLEGCYRPR